ncbi:alkylresorcinol/alkylpyrone synthase [Deinococcus metalli]|uniref:Alkylresorcinol/alkylpyrone synthase n=1 Tax=Deinococcus metalli TaxID=1141878 RepID=A0A7W8NNE9_9DEIO|nr:3-oxoacyl-[acyl-carrier-protein] synthase III C-terminal domain-containing protein [Deinococcus metalli]MBB5374630.1 alkylresorcinol/alkylpyrone synthase [Deinococcus metalli]GHF34880.1 chalcone synthase [Deinococcus metalli]
MTFPPVPVVRALVTGTPPHLTPQTEIRAAASTLFPRMAARPHMLDVFDNAQIDTRALARPLAWYLSPRGFGEKNDLFLEEARTLLRRLAAEALERAQVAPADVDAVIVVNTSGLSTPSLDADLIGALGLNRHAARLPVWGLGCAGGAAGLARAADLVRAGFRRVLYVAVELCSLTLVKGDESKSNFVGTALFSDGAAALVVTAPDVPGPPPLAELHGAYSTLIEHSEDIMGWDVVDDGLKVRFSRDIPTLVRSMMRDNVQGALAGHGWCREGVQTYVVHPGGVKVLAAYEEALELPPGALDASRRVLRDYGNMSSVTVLFVLEETLKAAPTGRAVLSAMGPGFSAEHVLLTFPGA